MALIIGTLQVGPKFRRRAFRVVADVPRRDLTLIPSEAALRCLDLMHEALSVPGSKLYVHCTAGQNRWPTVVWLCLVSCRTPPEEANRLLVAQLP